MSDEDGPVETEKPTLKTIARLSGLAVPTVSRALNGAPDIGARTKVLVRRIADEIGYVPNRAGVRLRTGRTHVISLVLSTESDMMNHTARLISSIAGGLRNTPYHLIVTPYFPDEDPMKPIRYIVETGSADAVILNQIQPEDPRVAYLMARGFPFVTHGRTDWCEAHAYFDFDNAAFGALGVGTLAGRGRRNLILIAPPLDQNYAREMIGGATRAAAECGTALTVADGVTSDSATSDLRHYARAMVERDPTIDGVVCGSTNATMAAIAGVEEAGFDVGVDIDFFARETIPFLKLFRRPILVAEEDLKLAGEFLARAAIRILREPEKPPMQFMDVPKTYR